MKKLFVFLMVLIMGLFLISCIPQYTLTITIDPQQAETAGCGIKYISNPQNNDGTYNNGSIITFKVVEAIGWKFDKFEGSEVTGEGTDANPYSVTVVNDTSLTVKFVEKTITLTVSIDPQQAATDGCGIQYISNPQNEDGTYNSGSVITFKVIEAGDWEFYQFSGLNVTGEGTDANPYSMTITNSTYLTVRFGKETVEDFEDGFWYPYQAKIPWYKSFVVDDNFNYGWESCIPGIYQTETVYDGTYSFEFGETSDDLSNYQWKTRGFLSVIINVPQSGGTVSFAYKVNCAEQVGELEEGFRFYRDTDLIQDDTQFTPSEPTLFVAGNQDWTTHTETYTGGTYHLLFSYWNTPVVTNAGDSTAWLDNITFSAGITFEKPESASGSFAYYDEGLNLVDNPFTIITKPVNTNEEVTLYADIYNSYYAYPTETDAELKGTQKDSKKLNKDRSGSRADIWLCGDDPASLTDTRVKFSDPDVNPYYDTLSQYFTVTMQPDEVIVGKTRLMIHGNPPVNGYLTVVIPYSNDYGQTYTKWPVIYKIVKLVPLPTTITLTVNDNDKMVGHGENFSATVQVLDQWGQPMNPSSSESITLLSINTDTEVSSTNVLNGTKTLNFSGTSSTVEFTNLNFTGPKSENITLKAVLNSNQSIKDSKMMRIVKSVSLPFSVDFEAEDGWTTGSSFYSYEPGNWGDNFIEYEFNHFLWICYSGSASEYGFGVPTDHTTGTANGQYLIANVKKGSAYTDAVFITPNIDLTSYSNPKLHFWYYMNGEDTTYLSMDVYDGTQWNEDVLFIVGQQGPQWKEAVIDLTNYKTGSVVLRFSNTKEGYQNEPLLAIDDMSIVDEVIPLAEKFQISTGSNTNVISHNETFNLTVTALTSSDDPMIPSAGETVKLIVTDTVTGLAPINAMNGVIYGTFNGSSSTVTFNNFSFVGTTSENITIKAVLGSNNSVFAITKIRLVKKVNSININFESSNGWVVGDYITNNAGTFGQNVIHDEYNELRWICYSGNAGGLNPTIDHTTGTSAGQYIILNTNSGASGDYASIITPKIDLTTFTNPKINFWYCIDGVYSTVILVDILPDSAPDWITLTGLSSPSTNWTECNVDISAYKTGSATIRIRSVKGAPFISMMAIDDLKVIEN